VIGPARPAPWRRLAWLVPALGYAALMFWLSSLSNPLPFLPRAIFTFDKLLHAGEYAGLAFLLALGLDRVTSCGPACAAAVAVALGSFFGLTDELHQALVPGRSADLLDWAADTVGAAVGGILAAVVLRRWGTRASIRA